MPKVDMQGDRVRAAKIRLKIWRLGKPWLNTSDAMTSPASQVASDCAQAIASTELMSKPLRIESASGDYLYRSNQDIYQNQIFSFVLVLRFS